MSDAALAALAGELRASHDADGLPRTEHLLDVADSVWPLVPLTPDWEAAETGFDPAPARRGERLRLFCDAYGLTRDERAILLDLVETRVATAADAADGDERNRLLRTSWHIAELRAGWETYLC